MARRPFSKSVIFSQKWSFEQKLVILGEKSQFTHHQKFTRKRIANKKSNLYFIIFCDFRNWQLWKSLLGCLRYKKSFLNYFRFKNDLVCSIWKKIVIFVFEIEKSLYLPYLDWIPRILRDLESVEISFFGSIPLIELFEIFKLDPIFFDYSWIFSNKIVYSHFLTVFNQNVIRIIIPHFPDH